MKKASSVLCLSSHSWRLTRSTPDLEDTTNQTPYESETLRPDAAPIPDQTKDSSVEGVSRSEMAWGVSSTPLHQCINKDLGYLLRECVQCLGDKDNIEEFMSRLRVLLFIDTSEHMSPHSVN